MCLVLASCFYTSLIAAVISNVFFRATCERVFCQCLRPLVSVTFGKYARNRWVLYTRICTRTIRQFLASFRHFVFLFDLPVKWWRQLKIGPCLRLVTEVLAGLWIRGKFKTKIDRSAKTPWLKYGVVARSYSSGLLSKWIDQSCTTRSLRSLSPKSLLSRYAKL